MSTDFSSFGFSAILSQIQFNKEILFAFAARKTTAVEQSYSSVKGEIRAIIFGLIKFEKFLSMSSYFFLVTDAMSLKWLVTMKTSSKLLLRWSTHIFSFNFKLLHRRGSIHLNADILSRKNHLQDNPTAQDTAEDSKFTNFWNNN